VWIVAEERSGRLHDILSPMDRLSGRP
jgi:hypothetical protein